VLCTDGILLFVETGLTYEALTGNNKQSVPDCERVISLKVISFMEKKITQRKLKASKPFITGTRLWMEEVLMKLQDQTIAMPC